MIRKIVYVIGILGAIVAAEGLYRFGSFVSMLEGSDAITFFQFLVM